MKCRYCNIALAPLRRLTDGEFCCDDHRHAFSEEQAARTEVFLQPPPQDALLPLTVNFSGGIPGSTAGPIGALEPREFKPMVVKPASSVRRACTTATIEACDREVLNCQMSSKWSAREVRCTCASMSPGSTVAEERSTISAPGGG